MLKKLRPVVALALIALIGIGIYYYWKHNELYPTTDDAYVQAHVVNIAPQVNGTIIKTYIKDQQAVTMGDPLFEIDPTAYRIAVNEAKAQYDNAIQQVKSATMSVATAKSVVIERQAELIQAEHDYGRIMTLVKERLYPATEGDKVTSQLSVAKAALTAAESQVNEAEEKLGDPSINNASIRQAAATLAKTKLDLRYTKVYAPASGYIANDTLRVGAEVTAFQPLFALVEDTDWWATANFKETDLQRIKPGQKATIKVDMYPDRIFIGKIDSISLGSGSSFALLPPENATGNWVKVTQRFPVKVVFTDTNHNFPLRMGSSCTVTVDTLG